MINRATDQYEDTVDLTAGGQTADSATFVGSMGETILFPSWDCYFTSPARAKQLIVDPGPLSVSIRCDWTFTTSGSFAATFDIQATSGHEYRADTGNFVTCVQLKDVTEGNMVADNCD
jgi:hypothetical protein